MLEKKIFGCRKNSTDFLPETMMLGLKHTASLEEGLDGLGDNEHLIFFQVVLMSTFPILSKISLLFSLRIQVGKLPVTCEWHDALTNLHCMVFHPLRAPKVESPLICIRSVPYHNIPFARGESQHFLAGKREGGKALINARKN